MRNFTYLARDPWLRFSCGICIQPNRRQIWKLLQINLDLAIRISYWFRPQRYIYKSIRENLPSLAPVWKEATKIKSLFSHIFSETECWHQLQCQIHAFHCRYERHMTSGTSHFCSNIYPSYVIQVVYCCEQLVLVLNKPSCLMSWVDKTISHQLDVRVYFRIIGIRFTWLFVY